MGFPERLKPGICMPESTSCLATVEGPSPPTSSHVREKIIEKETRMPVYTMALMGSACTSVMLRGEIT